LYVIPTEAVVDHSPSVEATAVPSRATAALIYAVAFVTSAIVMSFEMLGSRYLNPYFGSGIYTWAALISTVLIALTAGYFLGGALADRTASRAILALTVIAGSASSPSQSSNSCSPPSTTSAWAASSLRSPSCSCL
jgi:MFS family permease